MTSSNEIIIAVILGILLMIGIFFALRQLFTWYWKINERINLQKETNAYLKKLVEINKNQINTHKSDENN